MTTSEFLGGFEHISSQGYGKCVLSPHRLNVTRWLMSTVGVRGKDRVHFQVLVVTNLKARAKTNLLRSKTHTHASAVSKLLTTIHSHNYSLARLPLF